MINYGNSRALVLVNEKNAINEENEWKEGNLLEGEPLKIELNDNVFSDLPSTKQHLEEEEEEKIEQL